uniref:SCAN box domain-containing protein n=1 Tax=Oreochromis niloticus TaxID=8128 RepID=A0A669D3Y3_ORENI
MEFSLDDFVEAPALCKIEKCRKADLLLVADYYGVVVSGSAREAELRDELAGRLVEKGVLQGVTVKGAASAAAEAGAEAASAAAVGAEVDSVSDPGEATASADLRLTLCIKEVETRNKALEVQALHLRIRALELEKSPSPGSPASPNVSASTPSSFDISKHISLIPPFRESEVDSYFNAFERIAAALKWPKEFWSLLLQCKLVGKAQEVCSSLSIDQSLDYETLKKTVLQAYELVPEAYRQKFRNLCKAADQTFVEFTREKSVLFDKWCGSCKVKTLADLRTLILLEEFKKCLPERIVTYLNEQKVSSLTDAALLADEFVLTHKSVFCVEKSFPAVVTERKQWWRGGSSAAVKATVPARVFIVMVLGI